MSMNILFLSTSRIIR